MAGQLSPCDPPTPAPPQVMAKPCLRHEGEGARCGWHLDFLLNPPHPNLLPRQREALLSNGECRNVEREQKALRRAPTRHSLFRNIQRRDVVGFAGAEQRDFIDDENVGGDHQFGRALALGEL